MNDIVSKFLASALLILACMALLLAMVGFGKMVSEDSSSFWTMLSALGATGAFTSAVWIYFQNLKLTRSQYYVDEAIESLKEIEALTIEVSQTGLSNKILARKINCIGELCYHHMKILQGITDDAHQNIYQKHHTRSAYQAGMLFGPISAISYTGAEEDEILTFEVAPLPTHPTRGFHYYSLSKHTTYDRRIGERTVNPKDDFIITPFPEGVCILRALYIFRLFVLPPNFSGYPRYMTPREEEELFFNHLIKDFSDYINSCCLLSMNPKQDGYRVELREEPLSLKRIDLVTESEYWTEYFTP